MASYLIKKDDRTNAIVCMEYELLGYKFNPKKTGKAYLDVKEVTVVNPDLIENILTLKFEKRFKRLLAMAIHVQQDDDASEEDTTIVLDEIELVREILLNKYQNYLKRSKEETFLKKLRIIENEMRIKQLYIKEVNQAKEFEVEEPTKGRGR